MRDERTDEEQWIVGWANIKTKSRGLYGGQTERRRAVDCMVGKQKDEEQWIVWWANRNFC
jgi:hypothetical protein